MLDERNRGVGKVRENRLSDGLWLQIRDHRTKDGGLVSIYTDVTELKTSEQQAQAARQRFAEAIESITSGFALWDPEDRLVVFNRRYKEYFEGFADMVVPGAHFRDLIRTGIERGMFAADDPDAELDKIVARRAEISGEPRERHLANGLWLQITDHRTADGGVVSIYTDVTELKTREQEARAARQRFEDAIESISSGFSLWDAEDRLVSNRKKITNIPIPTLIIHAEEDHIIPLYHARDLYEASGAEEKRLVIIPNADHNDLLWQGRDQYFEAILSFVLTGH